MLQFNFNPFPTLETDRLILRRVVKADAPILFRLRNDNKVMQYIDRPRQKDIEETELFIEMIDGLIDQNSDINWAIALKDNESKMIGTIGFYRNQMANYRGEVGYMLDPDFWRKGIMDEALERILAFGFEYTAGKGIGFHSIEACINPENEASRRLLLKHNFVKEAYFKENYFYEGQFKDTEVYSRLNPNISPF